MGLKTTLGQLLIQRSLPADMQSQSRVLDKGGLRSLLQELAERHPDKYRDVSKSLADIGHQAAYTTGGNSFGLEDLRPAMATLKMRQELRKQIQQIQNTPGISDGDRSRQVVAAAQAAQDKLPDAVFNESKNEQNPLAMQLIGAGRGNRFNLSSLRGADLLYVDHRGEPIPFPVLRNYSEGLHPAEYFAGAFGARKGIHDLKEKTADVGFFAKQLVGATHRLIVTEHDDEEPHDPTTPRGLPVETDDPDNVGSLLAHPAGDYPRNTPLTPKIIKDLSGRGFKQLLVRSPTVGGPADGGVYARDAGIRERGGMAPLGDYVGIAAAQGLSEPLTQSTISSKHSGGIAGATAGAVSGFKAINNLVQIPKIFPGGATHSQVDGPVQAVTPAPQGGTHVTIGGERHYVPEGFNVTAKLGDMMEAGDTLSNGIPNPAEIVKHKGIGEGRRYFVQAFRDSLHNSGSYGNRRNIELLSRGLINHVRLTDEVGDWSPGDVVPYSTVERNWQPRPGSTIAPPNQHVGHYLERPVLHYTVGTKVGKNMVDMLSHHNVRQIEAHPQPPPFQPEMIRGMAVISQDPDWQTRFLGSYQQKSLLEGARRGAVSDTAGTSFVPALAEGPSFGIEHRTKGWQP